MADKIAYDEFIKFFNPLTIQMLGQDTFFVPNLTDGSGRRLQNIVGLRAIFVDFDTGIPKSRDVPLLPTFRIITSPRREHWYWCLSPNNYAMTHLTSWSDIQYRWIHGLGGDPSACDVTRLMRMPGTLSYKRVEPYFITMSEHSCPTKRYSLSELNDHFKNFNRPTAPFIADQPDELPPAAVRLARFIKWLNHAETNTPAAGQGARSGYYYIKAAAGTHNFALDPSPVARLLRAHDIRRNKLLAYSYSKMLRITKNALVYGRAGFGSAFTKNSAVINEE